MVEVPPDFRLVVPGKGPQVQIFQNREVGKDPPPLGALDDPLLNQLMGLGFGGVAALEINSPRGGAFQPRNRTQDSRLSRPVGSNKTDNRPLIYLKAYPA